MAIDVAKLEEEVAALAMKIEQDIMPRLVAAEKVLTDLGHGKVLQAARDAYAAITENTTETNQ